MIDSVFFVPDHTASFILLNLPPVPFSFHEVNRFFHAPSPGYVWCVAGLADATVLNPVMSQTLRVATFISFL